MVMYAFSSLNCSIGNVSEIIRLDRVSSFE